MAEFKSVSGLILSSWKVLDAGKTVSLTVSLPVGVSAATVVVPKAFNPDGTMATKSIVSEGGKVVWDGSKLVQPAPQGFVSATDMPEGVSFQLLNGDYELSSTLPSSLVATE